MSELKKCAACRKESHFSDMKVCMHSQMHYYVCDSKCMNAFYNWPEQPKKDYDALLSLNAELLEALIKARYHVSMSGTGDELADIEEAIAKARSQS